MNELEELRNEASDNARIYKDRQRSGMIRKYEERIQSKRASLDVQFQTQAVSRKTEVKMEWSLHSSCKYTLWSSDTEN